MTQHTKGPWEVKEEEADKPYLRIRGCALGRKYKIANVLYFTDQQDSRKEKDEVLANARLIAAAPETAAERDRLKETNAELLEALENMLQFAEVCHRQCEDQLMRQAIGNDIMSARNAIAKARGEA